MSEPVKALLLEEDESIAEAIRIILERSPFRPFKLYWNPSLMRTVALIEKVNPDVIILDLEFPAKHSKKIFQLLSKDQSHAPVVVLGSGKDEFLAMQMAKYGAQDYLGKNDLNPELLIRTLLYAVERTQYKAEISRENTLLRTILQTIPDNVFVKDREGRYIASNPAHTKDLCASNPTELLGKTCFDFFPEKLARDYHEDDLKVMKSGQPIIDREDYRFKLDGKQHWILTSKMPLLSQSGDCCGIVGISRDITRQKETESRLKQVIQDLDDTQVQLMEAEKLKTVGRLSAGIAHEIKNPIGIVSMGVQYLKSHLEKEEDLVDMLTDMEMSIKKASDVIFELLDYARPKDLSLDPVDLNEVIEHALILFRVQARSHKIRLEESLSPKLQLISGNANKIDQVLLNLFLNAMNAMPDGGTLRIETREERIKGVGANLSGSLAEEFLPGDTAIVASVYDTGKGIPESALSKIYEPFYTTQPSGQGTGLGLTVSRKIIEIHHGVLLIKNRKEGGVVASMYFHPYQE